MIPIKPYWFAKILNGEKGIEVRKNKALAKAIQKLIDAQGYALILGYCTKEEPHIKECDHFRYVGKGEIANEGYYLNGKVVARFHCDKVEEIIFGTTMFNGLGFFTGDLHDFDLYAQSCLKKEEMRNYLKVKANGFSGYAIHISQLEIFDKPKELSEFKANQKTTLLLGEKIVYKGSLNRPLTKAPQNFVYVEVE